jgi:hypothetical protein
MHIVAFWVYQLGYNRHGSHWLTRETIDFEDKEANDRLNFEMVQVVDEAEFDGLVSVKFSTAAELDKCCRIQLWLGTISSLNRERITLQF